MANASPTPTLTQRLAAHAERQRHRADLRARYLSATHGTPADATQAASGRFPIRDATADDAADFAQAVAELAALVAAGRTGAGS